jgi:uncharacterized protein YbjT (DUF2867 family)
VGDLDDPETIRPALAGVGRVFLTSANGPLQVEQEVAVVDAAVAADAPLVVKLSTIGAEAGSPLPGASWNGRVETHLAGSGLPSVVLRSNAFMSNLLAFAEPVSRTGALIAPAGSGKVSVIDPRDVAAAFVAVLTSDGHNGHTYVLTGPEPVTYDDVARELSAVTGRTVG